MRGASSNLAGVPLLGAVAMALAVLLTPTAARADPPAAQRAVARARALGLARSVAWRRLVLYRPRAGGGWSSQVDGADFFLAARGARDPAAELEATLLAFFVPPLPGDEDKHAFCMFPARRMWLESALHFTADLLRPPACPALERYVAEMDAESASFVFASNFIENPVSAFGHTLLHIRKKGTPAAANAEELQQAVDRRDHGLDYTAVVDTDNALLYVVKGLGGLFPGTFRFRTYDAMLRDYGGYETRDLWEYELTLTAEEVERLVMHLWELAHATIHYAYLTENCSYHILAAIDAAAPRLRLVEQVKPDVMPLDTVKAVFDAPGLVRGVVYRPSVRSVFRASLARLDARERDLVDGLLVSADAPLPSDLPEARAALVLDTAKLALDVRFAATMTDGKDQAALRARRRLVERRRAIDGAPAVDAIARAPRDKEPHRGHGSMRVLLGTGMTSPYGTGFATFGYRLALHDLLDPPDGEPELLQLQFVDTRVRYDHGRQKLTLDTLTFTELLTLAPLRSFEHKLSWRVRAYGMRLHDRAAPDAFAHGLDGAVGASLGSADDHVVAFLMADAYFGLSGDVDGVAGSVVRVGVGPLAGLRLRLPADTIGLVTATTSYLPGQSLATTFDVRASLRTRLGTQVAMGLEGAAQPRALELLLGTFLYF
jgi:hypothetical protein